ncbi:hypothetical protein KNV19_gp78 [Gordonia phage Portcullis]|uniref:Uncharacterized protein n=1 Tax=Gordonia phage Portcullis TaxID=2762414 RepID=A0A7G8LGM0_9CAUD|nr:hypothetical protein KNV19_gp78 [Gordonia phage Portcullis]QNJ56392.1 hypothetical protein SEA_PORTCULLIS_78 [Gordonia phage Portcullis]
MIRRARGRHTVRHLGAAAIPAPDLVKVLKTPDDLLAAAIWGNPCLNWTPPIPDGPVGVFMNGRVYIDDHPFAPPPDSPFARMCRQLDDMQPTIRQLTQDTPCSGAR